jgi:chromosome segregation ATPase
MDEEEVLPENTSPERALQMYEQRVTKVEETIRFISVEQQRQWGMIERITDTLEAISNRVSTNELADVAIRERTEQHSKNIEHLQSDQVDISKLLNKHDNDIEQLKSFWIATWNALKWLAAIIGSLILGYIFSHYVK